jgi:light-regulated signal transduction histidine kinase (bacteriophytochrome)
LLVVTEPELRVDQASKTAASFLGLPEQSLVGQRLDGQVRYQLTEALRRNIAWPIPSKGMPRRSGPMVWRHWRPRSEL